MTIKFFFKGGDIYKNNEFPGVSQVEQNAICGSGVSDGCRTWCFHAACTLYRSAALWHSCCGSLAPAWATTFSARTMLTCPGRWI